MKYVIDRNSLINLQRYYIFDKYNFGTEYEKWRGFFQNKFNSGEIVIIDKVDKEGIELFKENFSINNVPIASTDDAIAIFNTIASERENYNPNCTNSNIEKNALKKEEAGKADLWLIAYCQKLKDSHTKVCLITEETRSEEHNTKLYKKIPSICKNYNILCKNLPYLIFNYYAQEIKLVIKVSSQ